MGKLIKAAAKLYVGICCVLFVTKLVLSFCLRKQATKRGKDAYSIAVLGDGKHQDVMKVASYLEIEPMTLTLANAIRKIESALQRFGLQALLGKVQTVLVKWMGAI